MNYTEGNEWLAAPPDHIYPRKIPGTHCTGGWVAPTAGWTQRVEEKFSTSVGGRTPVAKSVAIHYSDWATWLTILVVIFYKF
jgi:hypothetical protein